MIGVALFTENDSPFGNYFLTTLAQHYAVELQAVSLREQGHTCFYYREDDIKTDNAALAEQYDIPILRPTSIADEDFINQIRNLSPDYFIVANYQLKLNEELLAIPHYAAINFHPSPLPRYAGLAPFYWMSECQEKLCGVSAIIMNESLDAGDIIAQHLFRLDGTETSEQIRELTFKDSWHLFDLVLPTVINHNYATTPQDLSQRTYFGKPPVMKRREYS